MSHICTKCQKNFSSVSTLNRHTRNIHEKAHAAAVRGDIIFECDDCAKFYRTRKSFILHWRRNHRRIQRNEENITPTSLTRRCPICWSNFPSKGIFSHFISDHNLEIEEESHVFPDEESFKMWKENTEDTTSSRFTLRYSQNGKKMKMYCCHRSGVFKSGSKGIRHLKKQGSRKINAFCPAAMRVVESEDGIQVKYTKTHVGHTNDLCHLDISEAKKIEIACKLIQNVSKQAILRDIRNSHNGEIKREHLVKMKDIDNVAFKYNINHKLKQHSNDEDSKEMTTDSLKKEDYSFVRFHKPQGTRCKSAPFLNIDDFVLILMNSMQADLLRNFGKNIVCVDGTHKIADDCTLFSISIIDEYHAEFPCSIMITNRKDTKMLDFFYRIVKNVVGSITPRTFMSDMTSELYTKWETIMGSVKTRLFCSWHVRKNWRENLRRIKNEDKRKPMLQFLETVADELDEGKFTILLKDLTTLFEEDPDLRDYGIYFTQHYYSNAKYWAACHRNRAQINTNISLERMHKTFEYCYFDGNRMTTLDKSIRNVLTFLQDKLFDRLTTLHVGNITKKVELLRSKHTLYNTVDVQRESENVYLVSSLSGKYIYRVVRKDINCECKIVCEDCETCIHVYCCTCRDNTISFHMCKHIHSVCMYQTTDPSIPWNQTNTSQDMSSSNNYNEVIVVDYQDDGVTDSDCQDTNIENDFSSTTVEESIVTGLSNQKLQKVNKQDVEILFRTILKRLETEEEITSLYESLEHFQTMLEISQRHGIKSFDVRDSV